MSNVVARSIFNTTVAERSWRTYLTSGIVHAVVIGLAFLIVVPTVQEFRAPVNDHVTLIAPPLPKFHPKIQAPRVNHVAKLVMPVRPAPLLKPIPPPVIPPPVAKTIVPPAAPVVHSAPPQLRIMADTKPELPPTPKPVIKSGSFQDTQVAKATPAPKQVVVGGFGDPRGVQPSENRSAPVLMAKVGSFESPLGAGQTGGGGHLDTGGVKQAGFGNAGVPNNSTGTGRPVSSIRTGGFGDNASGAPVGGGNGTVRSTAFGETVAAAPRQALPSTVAAFTPVEILFKPKPAYSPEARGMGLEGQVSLEVVFQASGAVKVVRVIKGLGHGLDEAAQQAAAQVRFKPATRSGAPVDTNATISITFELS